MPDLFSTEEFNRRFLDALGTLEDSTYNLSWEHSPHSKDEASLSGVGSCALQQWAYIAGIPRTDPRDPAGVMTTTMGHLGQQLVAHVMRTMGYNLFDEEKLVDLNGIPGHVDGKVTGLDLGDSVAIWDSKFKGIYAMFGTKNSYGMAVDGLPYAAPEIYLQQQGYIKAEDADFGILTAHPFDLGANRVQAAIKKAAHSPVYRIVLERDDEAGELALTRGKLLNAAVKGKAQPAREFDPMKDNFPCGYCEVKAWCVVKGDQYSMVLPPIPEDWKVKPVEIMEVA